MTATQSVPSIKVDNEIIVAKVTEFCREHIKGRSPEETIELLSDINLGVGIIGRDAIDSYTAPQREAALAALMARHGDMLQRLGIPAAGFSWTSKPQRPSRAVEQEVEAEAEGEEEYVGEEKAPAARRGRPRKTTSRVADVIAAPRKAKKEAPVRTAPRTASAKESGSSKAKGSRTDSVMAVVAKLARASKNEGVGIAAVSDAIGDGLSKQQVAKALAELIEQGSLRSEGQTRARRYFVA